MSDRKKMIEEAAHADRDKSDVYNEDFTSYSAFKRGAQWADENPAYATAYKPELIRDSVSRDEDEKAAEVASVIYRNAHYPNGYPDEMQAVSGDLDYFKGVLAGRQSLRAEIKKHVELNRKLANHNEVKSTRIAELQAEVIKWKSRCHGEGTETLLGIDQAVREAVAKERVRCANDALKVMSRMIIARPLDRQRMSDEYYDKYFSNSAAKETGE